MKTILITGGAGFIGSHTADALLEKGYRVRVLDRLDQQIHGEAPSPPRYLDPRIELMIGDVRNRQDVVHALDGVDGIFHFAAQTGVGQSMYDIHSYCDVNINGTAMVLDVLANSAHQVKKLILSSSRAVYGEGTYSCASCGIFYPAMRSKKQLEKKMWHFTCPTCNSELRPLATAEDKPRDPISMYAITKRVQEDLVKIFTSTYGLPSIILRYFNVYGSRQAINNPYTGIGAIFTNRALSGQNINIYEDGCPGRDFVNVRDVVQANLLGLENHTAENGIFNVGSGTRLSVLDLAQKIIEITGSSSQLEFTGQFRVGDIRDCYADLTRSRRLLGYAPQISFGKGIEELVAWAKGEKIEDTYARAEKILKEKRLG